MSFSLRPHVFVLATIAVCCSAPFAVAGTAAITAGFNLGIPGPFLNIPFQTFNNSYQVDQPLIFSPAAGPIAKDFGSPVLVTGAPILLVGSQPLPFPVNENFPLENPPGAIGQSVSDWHEVIITPGWHWIQPGDPSFPTLFPTGTSLITRDGLPWASTPIPSPAVDPTRIDVKFSPITPGHVLDVHKALVWVGTDANRVWGDGPNETFIQILEYPTPEPSSLVLASLAILGLLLSRKRWR